MGHSIWNPYGPKRYPESKVLFDWGDFTENSFDRFLIYHFDRFLIDFDRFFLSLLWNISLLTY